MRPGFTLTDNGPTEYAAGDVTLGVDGAPQSYQIAEGDVMDVIATRFDITVDDILWLNPNLQGSRVPKAHTALNLDRNLRGL